MTEQLPPPWDCERDETLVCVAVRPETHDVTSFVFAAAEPRLFSFLPGQFMTFDLDGGRLQRCYTIASPPTRPWRIEITVRRGADGAGSAWLHDAMRPGTRIRASGPMGEFTFGENPAGKYLFLAAGSGITPLMSMARTLHDLGSDADCLFVHNAHSAADLIFAAELAAMQTRSGLRALGMVSVDRAGQRWNGFRGRLSSQSLAAMAPDLRERQIFCCGPAGYMQSVRGMLDAAGVDRTRYHEESFDFAADAPRVEEAPVAVQEGFAVAFARAGQSMVCPPGMTVLAAARAAGIRLPSACAKGVCGTCKSRLLSGTVEMHHGGGIRQREIDAGLALLCCATPTSDLVIER